MSCSPEGSSNHSFISVAHDDWHNCTLSKNMTASQHIACVGMQGEGHAVKALAFSPDGTMLAVAAGNLVLTAFAISCACWLHAA